MKRRKVVVGVAASGAGVLFFPSWISHAFGQRTVVDELAGLSAAYRQAQQSGRPLLVLIIPEDARHRSIRNRAFSELLNFGHEDVFVDLAQVELACASMSSLRRLVPRASGEPWMVLVEPNGGAVRAIVPELPPLWRYPRPSEYVQARITAVADAIHAALTPDAASISRRAAQARRHLSATDLTRIEHAIASGEVAPEDVALAPAIVAEAAEARPELASSLHLLGINRWRAGRIPNSRWINNTGCGAYVEQTEQEQRDAPEEGRALVLCGMGHVEAFSQRFLDWYTQP